MYVNIAEPDYVKAREWWQKAAERGHVNAQCNLGIIYDLGDGVSQDYGAAIEWYQKAAEQGAVNAQISLGEMYEKGLGVAENPQAAYMLYYLAQLCGSEKAGEKMHNIEALLTEAQINEAQSQARQKFSVLSSQ